MQGEKANEEDIEQIGGQPVPGSGFEDEQYRSDEEAEDEL
jgi:hypothetical protein